MIKRLNIEISSSCNLNCKMCFRNNWFDESIGLMPDSAVERLKTEIIKGDFETVFFGGMGEPLLHPRLTELVSAAHSVGKRTEIITNATLLNKETSQNLINAGLDTLWVSVDGFSKESYEKIRKGSLYEKIIGNINTFNSLRKATQLGITFVIMKENKSELEEINSFTKSLNADIINVSHAIPESPIEEKDTIYEKDYPIGKMKEFVFSGGEKKRDFCPFVMEKSCFIRWDGEVTPCMQLLHNCYTYLYTERRKNYFKAYGNITEKTLMEIWNGEEYKAFRKRVETFDFPCCTVCLGCDDRLENVTDCMYNEGPTCGACLWAQGYIRCP